MQKLALPIVLLACALPLVGQRAGNGSTLSIPTIMQGERFVGYLPENVFWSLDSRHIYFSWNPEQDTLRSLYRVSVEGGTPEPVSLAEQRLLPRNGVFDADRSRVLYAVGGDLFLEDLQAGTRQRITHTSEREADPRFSGDEERIVFQSGNNLYAWATANGSLVQLSDLRRGEEPTDRPLPEYQQWLEDQQLELFQVRRDEETAAALREQRNDSLQLDHPTPIYLGDDRPLGLEASPDLRFITFTRYSSPRARDTEVPYWVTESGYVDLRDARAKVGSPQGDFSFHIYDRRRDSVYSVATGQIPGIKDKPDFLREYQPENTEYVDTFDTPRPVRILGPFYSELGLAAVVVRSLDNKDRWIMLLDPESATLKLVDRQRDEAWIGGPGISGWNAGAGTIGWIPGTNQLYFQSEASGFSHLYLYDADKGRTEQLTEGPWEVREVQLAPDHNHFYLTANREGPEQQHVYRMPVAGGDMEQLTRAPGNHQATLSPDGTHLAIRYSYSNVPWEIYVQPAAPGSEARQLTRSTTGAFQAYDWRDPELVRFTARDEATVTARLYRPDEPEEGGPAVIFVHGAGYLQNAHSWWSSYFREYMFHNFLADNGYTVLDIDYRGSDGYGRDWRTGIYRHMGGKDLTDQVDGARFLVEAYGVDPDRIGVYGGSYGGFITLMALLTTPETFRAGAALRSVTDWAHYNHGYTSNILNTPVEDPRAYERSSPINFAEGLQGHLLILHGMVDTNVQFQDVVRLAQRFIELGKENWEFAVFPVEGHGFSEPSSWTDEYRRIFELFEQTLK